MRLDKFLADQNKEVSRSRIQKAIKNGQVSVNGQKILEPDFIVKPEDKIELPEFKNEELKASNLELKVVFENDDLAVIDKPAGMVVHPGAGNKEDTLAQALMTRYPGIEKVGEPHRPGIVHRLDEDTSGLILIAKNAESYEYFKKQFLERKVEKEYLALVHGAPPKTHDLIDLPIQRVPLKQKMSVGDGSASGGKLGKPAQTEYWVLKEGVAEGLSLPKNGGLKTSATKPDPAGQVSLLRVKLHTGRTHQIRVHLAHIGNPIVGDRLYGNKEDSKILDRQFLHAYRLKFKLMDGTWLEVESPLPEDLKEVLTKANIIYDDKHI
ncbi:MAG: RluA family pseudouridine synthase [Candidatus Doudnabacteria bacterium]